MIKYTTMLVSFCCVLATAKTQAKEDAILGKWTNPEKTLIVDVYKVNSDYKAKIAWFHNPKDSVMPIDQWMDNKNPDEALRTRKILGMDILSGMEYNDDEDKWINGKIYDATSGKTWDSVVWLTNAQTMEVRGYYIFRFIGRNMKFTRM